MRKLFLIGMTLFLTIYTCLLIIVAYSGKLGKISPLGFAYETNADNAFRQQMQVNYSLHHGDIARFGQWWP